MSLSYIPMSTPDVSSIRKKMLVQIDKSVQDEKLLNQGNTDEHDDVAPSGGEDKQILDPDSMFNETMGYSPAIGNIASPVTDNNRDDTDLNKDNPADDSILKTHEDGTDQSHVLQPDSSKQNDREEQNVPDELIDYFDETAMKAKQRNALPAEEFGIPRLRAYPLNDEKHVRMAISMFKHCKNPKDKTTLANKIFAKVSAYKMDIKISKDSALYSYAPKSLQEASADAMTVEYPAETLDMVHRTKEDVVREHLNQNSLFYNNLFYSPDYVKTVRAMENLPFLDYFYPNFKTHNLYARLKTALGGLGMSTELYQELGMRAPMDTDFTKPIGWGQLTDDMMIWVDTNYDESVNWFKYSLLKDYAHIAYCLHLYSILADIMLNPGFRLSDLTPEHMQVLTDWGQQISYHYDLFTNAAPMSDEYVKQAQYLYDLYWNPNENPYSADIVASNIMSMVAQMAVDTSLFKQINESTELLDKKDTAAYLSKELGLGDDLFLLPSSLEYPVFSKGSVRMAMDIINHIPTENRKEYVTNLNRKYRELGCNFAITADHPYAQYADKNIIDHMSNLLCEGNTVVKDDGTSNVSTDVAPWYCMDDRIYTEKNLMDNKELGPNTKKNLVDFTRTDSVL